NLGVSMGLRSLFITNRVYILAVAPIWCVSWNTSPAIALEGDTRGNTIEVRKAKRETARSETARMHIRARQASRSTTGHNTSNSGGGGRASKRQATVEPRAKWARSVLRTICTIDGNFGTSFGQCAAPAPAAPTAPAPAVPAPQSQTQIVSEP